jgi:hypothetical protein
MLFKCEPVALPLPSGEPIEAAIAGELPAFAHYLLYEHQIRGEIKDEKNDRFGIKAYHHPVVLRALAATTMEHQFLEEIDRMGPFDYEKDGEFFWRASLTQIREKFLEWASDPHCRKKHLDVLVSNINKDKLWMSKLEKQEPERVSKKRGNTRDLYYIKALPGWKPGGHQEETMEKRIEEIATSAVDAQLSDVARRVAQIEAQKVALPVVNKQQAVEAAQKAAWKVLAQEVRNAAIAESRKAAARAASNVLEKAAT